MLEKHGPKKPNRDQGLKRGVGSVVEKGGEKRDFLGGRRGTEKNREGKKGVVSS